MIITRARARISKPSSYAQRVAHGWEPGNDGETPGPTRPPIVGGRAGRICLVKRGGPRSDQGSIRMPNSITADWPGPSEAIVVVTVPAVPGAGVTIPPSEVEAGTVAE